MRVLIENPAEKRLKTSRYVLSECPALAPPEKMRFSPHGTKNMISVRGDNVEYKYIVNTDPFTIECYCNDQLVVTVNSRQLFNYECYRSSESMLKNAKDTADLLAALTLWEQTSLQHHDPCPSGPASVAMDFVFHGSSYLIHS